ncbi:MAG TPA: glycoside hydrolase family 127 protein [Lacunisphaera sp.]|nr:glycoside hydrolase family 127 protein [Lacunisphaera sp.]
MIDSLCRFLAPRALFLWAVAPLALSAAPRPFTVAPKIADQQNLLEPDQVRLTGFLGRRIMANEKNRLLVVDEDRLLVSYRNRPGVHQWDGEHVGKWLHAATLAWVNTGDAALRAKLDRVAAGLLQTQGADGYLGTYLPEKRWTSWDVWAHKYNLIGLLTYHRYTGDPAAMAACVRIADLLARTFGEQPGQLNLVLSGSHAGMAASSVLEPMVWMYRLTGEVRYLEFCQMVLRRWDGPRGPRLISDLAAGRGVHQVGNAKAYEMMSCLNGALELYRVTGDGQILKAIRHAWEDILAQRLYITGTCSQHEYFHTAHELPNSLQNIAETCVTVTWLQLNAQLLRLTGESIFADELERTGYNQLLGAQHPDGSSWGYYVELEDNRKPFSADFSGHCCLSSGPRGITLLPMVASATDADGIVVNFFESGESTFTLADGRRVTLQTTTDYPLGETVHFTLVHVDGSGPFGIKIRIPGWARQATLDVASTTINGTPRTYQTIKRDWQIGDTFEMRVPARPRLVMGAHGNAGLAALTYGPLVLSADDRVNPAQKIGTFQIYQQNIEAINFTVVPPAETAALAPGVPVFQITAASIPEVAKGPRTLDIPVRFVPFAEAGNNSRYKVWVPVRMWSIPPESAYFPPKVSRD